MELDLSREWRLFLAAGDGDFLPPSSLASILASPDPAPGQSVRGPVEFAVAELARGLALLSGLRLVPGRGDEGDEVGIFILNPGTAEVPGPDGVSPRPRKGYAWRASPGRVEIHADSGSGLVAGVEAFLEAAGLLWPAPGDPPRLVREGRVELSSSSGRRAPDAPLPILILGHGSYLEAAGDYLPWAARNGYAGVFFHTTTEALAFGAAPLAAYDRMRPTLLPLLARLGLEVELGGHGLSEFLPRRLFKTEPGLFRMKDGARSPDSNLCVSNPRSLELVSAEFSAFVAAHPEAGVFHVWPDDLPGGGWCGCPGCSSQGPAGQALTVARTLAAVLGRDRPGALLSFLAYHDTEGLEDGEDIPPNLELLWAPRRRSWARAYGDPSSDLNAASAARLETARLPFATASPSRVSIFEYWEDAILFKTAVPPLGGTMAADLLHYAPRASRVGILLTGCGLPLAPRPNPFLLPRLLASASRPDCGPEAQARALASLRGAWASALYGEAAPAMARYWEALEEAWRLDLDLEAGDTEISMPPADLRAVDLPPADWGDPWTASRERLGEKRARCDELFGWLRKAEAALAEARGLAEGGAADEAIEAEAREYALSSAILELDCARLAAYHEASGGQAKAAAEIALIGLGVMYSARKAMEAFPDPRARRNGAFLLELHYGLRFRSLTRAARGPVLGELGRAQAKARLALSALGMRRIWEKGE